MNKQCDPIFAHTQISIDTHIYICSFSDLIFQFEMGTTLPKISVLSSSSPGAKNADEVVVSPTQRSNFQRQITEFVFDMVLSQCLYDTQVHIVVPMDSSLTSDTTTTSNGPDECINTCLLRDRITSYGMDCFIHGCDSWGVCPILTEGKCLESNMGAGRSSIKKMLETVLWPSLYLGQEDSGTNHCNVIISIEGMYKYIICQMKELGCSEEDMRIVVTTQIVGLICNMFDYNEHIQVIILTSPSYLTYRQMLNLGSEGVDYLHEEDTMIKLDHFRKMLMDKDIWCRHVSCPLKGLDNSVQNDHTISLAWRRKAE